MTHNTKIRTDFLDTLKKPAPKEIVEQAKEIFGRLDQIQELKQKQDELQLSNSVLDAQISVIDTLLHEIYSIAESHEAKKRELIREKHRSNVQLEFVQKRLNVRMTEIEQEGNPEGRAA